MAYDNPFSFLVDAIWGIFEANTDFAALVKEENRIKLDSGFKPFKSTLMEASVPEVCILLAGKRLFEENPCDGASIVQILHVTIASGVQKISDLLPVEWRIIQAIHTALNTSTNSLMDLTWEDEKIIKSIIAQPIEEGLTYDDLNRELKGWAAILPLEVKLFFSHSLLGLT